MNLGRRAERPPRAFGKAGPRVELAERGAIVVLDLCGGRDRGKYGQQATEPNQGNCRRLARLDHHAAGIVHVE